MTARIRQALMIRPWQGIMIVGIVAAFGVFLFSGPGARYEWAAVILFGLVTILQLGKVQAAPPGSQERYDRVALGGLLAAICGSYTFSAVEASGVHVPWATPLRIVLFGTGVVCVLLYLIVRWLIWRGRPDRAGAR